MQRPLIYRHVELAKTNIRKDSKQQVERYLSVEIENLLTQYDIDLGNKMTA